MITCTKTELLSLFDYHPSTGTFTHKKRLQKWIAEGAQAGAKTGGGYIHLRVNGRFIKAHRAIWFLETGEWPSKGLDHINGVTNDNRIQNLRVSRVSENQWNSVMRKDNSSGIKGVRFVPLENKWRARIGHNGKSICVGTFKTAQEAEAALRAKRIQLHGEFARHQ